MSKSPYYVFLDIDGTLWDYSFRMKNKDLTLNPESLQALNSLLDNLRAKFDVKIVITSRRRQNFKQACDLLYKYGLDSKYVDIDKTPWEDGERGEKIIQYLKDEGYKYIHSNNNITKVIARLLNKKVFNNYVVIEDETDKIKKQIPTDRIIVTNILSRSLDKYLVKKFLSNEKLIEDEDVRQ